MQIAWFIEFFEHVQTYSDHIFDGFLNTKSVYFLIWIKNILF